MDDRVMKILADETGCKSYKAHKYGLDHTERPYIDYNEDDNIIWQRPGETRKPHTYVSLERISIDYAKRGVQRLSYFLDGSRRVYKVDDHAYSMSNNRTIIYPIIAGQIGVGCCKRIDRIITPERFSRKIVISIPDIADADGKPGFFEAMPIKLNRIQVLQQNGIEISRVIPYKTAKDVADKFEDRGTAKIQECMMQCEQDMVADLVRDHMLNQNNFLVKDGSLEYRPSKEILHDERKAKLFKNNYTYVIGLSKHFNPEVCMDISGKPNPGYIAELPLYHRTPVAYYKNKNTSLYGDIAFAIWYIRLRDISHTRTAFDGVLKVEKMLVTQAECTNGIDSDLVDMLSALIINERNPVCYGSDLRWANHIYPIYLTETYVKSQYLSAESFLHLF